jgi:hypothetical protein
VPVSVQPQCLFGGCRANPEPQVSVRTLFNKQQECPLLLLDPCDRVVAADGLDLSMCQPVPRGPFFAESVLISSETGQLLRFSVKSITVRLAVRLRDKMVEIYDFPDGWLEVRWKGRLLARAVPFAPPNSLGCT